MDDPHQKCRNIGHGFEGKNVNESVKKHEIC
jgi:hypothetical protein